MWGLRFDYDELRLPEGIAAVSEIGVDRRVLHDKAIPVKVTCTVPQGQVKVVGTIGANIAFCGAGRWWRFPVSLGPSHDDRRCRRQASVRHWATGSSHQPRSLDRERRGSDGPVRLISSRLDPARGGLEQGSGDKESGRGEPRRLSQLHPNNWVTACPGGSRSVSGLRRTALSPGLMEIKRH